MRNTDGERNTEVAEGADLSGIEAFRVTYWTLGHLRRAYYTGIIQDRSAKIGAEIDERDQRVSLRESGLRASHLRFANSISSTIEGPSNHIVFRSIVGRKAAGGAFSSKSTLLSPFSLLLRNHARIERAQSPSIELCHRKGDLEVTLSGRRGPRLLPSVAILS